MDRKQKNGLSKLLKLATFLKRKKFKKGQFNMIEWWKCKQECGTQACAIGWATTIPSFKRAGLKLRIYENGITPAFRDKTSFSAVADFFNISYYEAEYLFFPQCVSTVDNVVNKIREFVKEKKNGKA